MRSCRGEGTVGESGITLLEIVIASALMVMAGLMAMPGMMKLRTLINVNSAIRGIAADLQAARFRAVADHINVIITFDPEGNRYGICLDQDRDGCGQEDSMRWVYLAREYPGVRFGSAREVMRTSYGSWVDPCGIHFRDRRVVWRHDGRPDRNGSIYIIPERDIPLRRARMRAVSVILTTGRMRMWRYDERALDSAQRHGPWSIFF